MSNTTTPSLAQLHRAIKVSEQIEKLQAELASILGTSGASSTGKRKYTKKSESAAEPAQKKRLMSPEAREKIAAAQRKRWAKSNKEKKAKAKSEAAKAE